MNGLENLDVKEALAQFGHIIGLRRTVHGDVTMEPQFVVVCMWASQSTLGSLLCTMATLVFVTQKS